MGIEIHRGNEVLYSLEEIWIAFNTSGCEQHVAAISRELCPDVVGREESRSAMSDLGAYFRGIMAEPAGLCKGELDVRSGVCDSLQRGRSDRATGCFTNFQRIKL